MPVYLCTCGTSVAKKLPREPRFDAAWVAAQGGVEPAAERIYETFQTARLDDETALQRDLSAELHALARMGVTAKDRVILYSSETLDGQACAQAIRLYLEQALPGIQCAIEVIPGLQVTDAQRFRTQGVLNFTKSILKAIESYGAGNCVLNPTGGFKSLVPYTVLLGMLKGVEARYIFEQSTALIHLPMMPVEFARSRLEPLRALLERIQHETAIPRLDLERALPDLDERRFLAPLFEDAGADQITLSPVGFLAWDELERPSALVPYLSRRALDDLLKVRAIEGCKPGPYIQHVARSRALLDKDRHESVGKGLFWLKPGEHTRDRYLVSLEGWRLLVWRICDHDEYDSLSDQNRRSELGGRILAERRAQYEPFVRLELYEG